jgi:cytochrome c oxidase subunit 1
VGAVHRRIGVSGRTAGVAGGLLAFVGATDHKRTALRVAASSLLWFLVAGLLALIMRTELARPGMQVVSHDGYDQLFTLHGSLMIYGVLTPLSLAIGVYLVPLMVGAADIALPRLCLLGSWLIPLGAGAMVLGLSTANGAGRAGWTAFTPLSNAAYTPGVGMDLWIVGVFFTTLGTLCLAIPVALTIFRLRVPGMTLLRLPVFCWTMIATVVMTVSAFPVLVVTMALLEWDRRFDGAIFSSAGGAVAYQNLFWFYGHPVVYVMFFPFVGVVAEVIATSAGRRFFGYRLMVVALLAFAALSMSVWAHHMFTSGRIPNRFFSLASTLIVIPAGIEYVELLGTMWGGRIRFPTSMLFALAFLVQFLIGGLTGLIVASPPLDYHVHDSYFVVAHFHYTLFAGSLFALLAGVYHWFPKVTGRMLSEPLGKAGFWVLVIGTNLTFMPMFVLGYRGMARRIADYPATAGLTGMNELATAGSYLLTLGVLLVLANIVRSLRSGAFAGDDPWGGHTLEWATSSPPPRLNFERPLPPVHSFAPLLDLREREAAHAP